MTSNYKKLGQYIRQVSGRNADLSVTNLQGVSITKKFIPSIANTNGTNMSTYKIVRRNQFAYGPVTSRNGDKISIALLDQDEAIISQAYTVFEIIDHDELDPEYLMMWFRRPEFDRYARFKSHGSVREIFGWDEMCDVELPIPDIIEQKRVVEEYKIVTDRIKLNKQISVKLEESTQTIYKHWFIDFEFPIPVKYAVSISKPELAGKSYASNGGKITLDEKNSIIHPETWQVTSMSSVSEIQNGFAFKSDDYQKDGVKMIRTTNINDDGFIEDMDAKYLPYEYLADMKYLNFNLQKYDSLLVMVGASVGKTGMVFESNLPSLQNQNMWRFRTKRTDISALYINLTMKRATATLLNHASGSARDFFTKGIFQDYKVLIPDPEVNKRFLDISNALLNYKSNNFAELLKLLQLRDVILSSMSGVKS